ncbi:hypothetical protein DY000_02000099 [Brassica cretica]|uniref:DUF627 domain-containing protein n=1 Tax=Brassica cretica TaxID=69181 RepID=A0ABQ7C1K9_BRACR|nr:hypothetical protein DY000_02000099 [Brassica cretica]
METKYENALRFESQGKYIEALEIISEAERCGNHSERLNILQAEIFMSLAEESENLYKKLVFLMAAVEAYSRNDACECVYPLLEISELLGSASFYGRVLKTAELFLNRIATALGSQEPDVAEDGVYAHLFEERIKLQSLVPVPLADFKPEAIEMKKENGAMVERLRPHWESSSENTKPLSEDGKFRFPSAIREFNLDIWMASLRSYQFVCRTLQTMHAKKEILVMKSSGSVNSKVIHLDAKILLIDKSRVKLLKHLTGMCLFDFRCYLNPPLKEYIIDCLRRRFI